MDRVAGILYLEIDLAALIVMITVLVKSLGFSRMASQKNFIIALSAQILYTFSETVFTAVQRDILPYNGYVLIGMKSFFFFAMISMAYLWYLYFDVRSGSHILEERKALVFSSALVWVVLYIIIANLFNHSVFYLNDTGQYVTGPWYSVIYYLFSAIYIYLMITKSVENAYKYRQLPEGQVYLHYAMFPIIYETFNILEWFFPAYPMVSIAMALMTLIMYVNSLDDVVSIDPLTQLINRRLFMKNMALWYSKRNEATPMYFMILDADRFKLINDVYGHTEGDAALVRIADSLRVACAKQHKKTVISRYGGDEFMILVEAAGEDEIKKLIIQIERTLKEKDAEAAAPYKLSLSIGYARLDEARNIKGVIDLADERQYAVKEVHHRIIDEAACKETK